MAYEIELKELPDRYVVTIRTESAPDQLRATFDEVLPEVDAQILEAGERPSGPAFAIYHDFREDHVDLEAGFPVGEPIPTEGRVLGRELVATPAAVTFHHGPYDGISEAYTAVQAWIEANGRTPNGPPWEVYWVGPGDDPDSSTWNTEVGFPIAED
jgi:effector-binding domain-containing protein